MFTSASNRRAVALAVTAVAMIAGLTPFPAGASSVPDGAKGGTVTLIDPGAVDGRVVLPGAPTVGAAGTNTSITTAVGTVVLTGSAAQTLTIDVVTTAVQSGEITAVGADGSFTMARRVESYDVVDNSDGTAGSSYAADEELADLVGVDFSVTYDAQGAIIGGESVAATALTAVQQAALDTVVEDGSNARFPAEPVGVGARWAVASMSTGSAAITATYTLTSLKGHDFTIDLVFNADVAALMTELPEGFDSASGTLTGTGHFAGELGNPFQRQATTTTDVDITLTGPGIELVTTVSQVEEQSTVG